MEQVFRNGKGDAGASNRKRRVGHHVAPERLDKADTRVLAAAAAARPPLVVSLGFESNAEPFHPRGVTGPVEQDPGNTDAGVIARRHQSREQVQLPVGAAGGSRVRHALGLQWVPWLGLHHLSQPLQPKGGHCLSLGPAPSWSPSRQAAMALITSLVSPGPRTGTETTPAC